MGTAAEGTNAVHLVRHVSGEVQERTLPSGDPLVTFRLVVPRPARRGARSGRPPGVDTLDVACWTARSRATASRLTEGQVVEVEGAIRRRFFAAGAGRASRYEVEVSRIRRSG